MSLASHGFVIYSLVHLILLLRSHVDLDDILVLYMTDCCMTTLSCLTACCMSMWDTHVSPYLEILSLDRSIFLDCVLDWRLVAPCLLFDRASD